MKSFTQYIMASVLLATLFVFSVSCEKIVSVDLETAEPQLVIDAAIDWEKNTSGNIQTVVITTTNAFFSQGEQPKVSGATVSVSDSQGNAFSFKEQLAGLYTCDTFSPTLNETYTLDVQYDGQHYTASDVLYEMPGEVIFVQNNKGGIFGNEIEIRGYFNDKKELVDNYYLVKIKSPRRETLSYISIDGKYYSDNQMFFIYSSDEIQPKDTLDFSVYRISRTYSNYIDLILNSTGSASGPFAVPPANIIGNMVNETNGNNNPLGAFRAAQYVKIQYIVAEDKEGEN